MTKEGVTMMGILSYYISTVIGDEMIIRDS